MHRRKFGFLFMALLVASGLLFADGEARAATFAYSISGEVIGSNASNATYRYTLTKTGDTTLSYVDFEIPVEIVLTPGTFPPTANNPYFSLLVSGAAAGTVEIYGEGIGDFGTKFGVGDTRYRVMKVNLTPPTTNQPFYITITLRGQNFANNRKFGDFNESERGAILIKAGNGSNTLTFTTAPTPTVVDPPVTPPPPPPVISSFSATPNPVLAGQCASLTWSVPAGTAVSISPPPTSITDGSAQICPVTTTTYTLTAGPVGSQSFAETTVTVTPLPVILIAQQTIEKKDASGNVTGRLTFYFENDVPACSCATGPVDPILEFPCNEPVLPANCSMAFQEPLLVCIPFPDKTQAQLLQSCADSGSNNCIVVSLAPTPESGNTCVDPNGCFSRCDELSYVTRATDMEVGPNSCTCTTKTVMVYSAVTKRYVPTPKTTCTGTPCP